MQKKKKPSLLQVISILYYNFLTDCLQMVELDLMISFKQDHSG